MDLRPAGVSPTPADSATAGPGPAVAAVGVTKRFAGGVIANNRVSFEARHGEVHALLGENGAGKTTLCNILTGLYRPDEGEVRVNGKPVRLHSPHEAQAAGIFMVHQHLSLVDSLTVAENVVLGWSRQGGPGFSARKVEAEIEEIAARYQMAVDPRARIWQLSLGERQRVDILKALYRGASILILDEPTTVLTPAEIDQLFSSVREMVAGGSSVIFISHKMPEVFAIADRTTILRKGRSTDTLEIRNTDARQLARLMVGHEMSLEVHPRAAAAAAGPTPAAAEPAVGAPPVLDVSGINVRGDFGIDALKDVSLTIAASEILGIAGRIRERAARAGGGHRRHAVVQPRLDPDRWRERAPGRPGRRDQARGGLRSRGPHGNRRVAEPLDRREPDPEDLPARQPAQRARPSNGTGRGAGNGTHGALRHPGARASYHGSPALGRERPEGRPRTRTLVAGRAWWSPPRRPAGSTSAPPSTSGACSSEAAKQGAAIMLISEDLDEIVELSDRIAVLYEGRVVGVVDAATANYEHLGLMMAGAAS